MVYFSYGALESAFLHASGQDHDIVVVGQFGSIVLFCEVDDSMAGLELLGGDGGEEGGGETVVLIGVWFYGVYFLWGNVDDGSLLHHCYVSEREYDIYYSIR